MSDTTSLADLPSDPAIGSGGSQNVVLQTTDKPTTYDPNDGISSANAASASVSGSTNPNSNNESNGINEQKMMNELISGIQQASANGGTSLPSRDIPTNTTHFSDDQVKPNYVPQSEQLEFLWVLPSRQVYNMLKEHALEIPLEERQLLQFVLEDGDGTLLKKCKKLNGEL